MKGLDCNSPVTRIVTGIFRIRCRHEQGGEVLRAAVPGDLRLPTAQPRRLDDDRRATRFKLRVNLSAQRFQRREQVLDRTLPHPLVTVQSVAPPPERHQRGEKANRGAREPQVEFGFCHGNVAPLPLYGEGCSAYLNRDTQRIQRVNHDFGVFGNQAAV